MYDILIERHRPLAYLDALPEKSRRIVREHILRLKEDPYPGHRGDKERLVIDGYEMYRLHVGRSYTVFYRINEEAHVVKVLDIMTLEEAHKRYGRL
ncbi:MAG: type II toxin-antitoxin system RelE/ParE family toxin [Methanomicrobiales archaeon]|nr:type II toxin-antitoxin system RelE/ParE family toxin [Methanomicrobiales archaeon]